MCDSARVIIETRSPDWQNVRVDVEHIADPEIQSSCCERIGICIASAVQRLEPGSLCDCLLILAESLISFRDICMWENDASTKERRFGSAPTEAARALVNAARAYQAAVKQQRQEKLTSTKAPSNDGGTPANER